MPDCEPYQIQSEVGRGGMGIVYRALDPILDRTVAIKMIRTGGLEGDSLLQERFFREGRSVAALSHPNIVTVYQMVHRGDALYIVMEFVEGPTLERWLEADPPPSRATLIDMLRQIAAGLDYAHRKGLVHRDIKPMNILVDEAGAPHITDFGLAKTAASPQLTQTGFQVGTPHYVSPEQAQGRQLDGRSDQFSLAVIAYKALTGKKPFDGEEVTTLLFKIVFEEPVAPHILNPELATPVDDVFHRAFSKDPNARYATCMDFIGALDAACAVVPAPAGAVPAPARVFPKKMAAAAVAGSLCLAIGVFAMTRLRSTPPGETPAPIAAAPTPTEPTPTQPPAPVTAPPVAAPAAPAKSARGTANREAPRDGVVEPRVAAKSETPSEPAPVVKKPDPTPVPPIARGMSDWERPDEWQSEGGWLIHKGGYAVTYGIAPLDGAVSFSAIVRKGKRLQWMMNRRDANNYALFQLEKRQFVAKDVVNGAAKDRAKAAVPDTAGVFQLQITVAPNEIVTSFYDGSKWTTLDRWTHPDRNLTTGKFGFLIPGSDEVGIANFKFTPK